MNKRFSHICIIVLLFILCGSGLANAWSGLIASSGDILSTAKWNELVNKILPIYSTGGLTGNVGIGISAPTARLHLRSGTATANTAPLKFTSGVNLTSPEAGSMEYNGTQLFFSPATTRNIIAQISGETAFTPGSIPFVTTNGYLTQNNGNLFWDNTNSRLGIGTITPNNKLEITQGTAGNSGLRFTNLTSASTATAYNGRTLSLNTTGDVILTEGLRQRVVLGADVINNNAIANTLADVTGLSFPVVTGLRYQFECKVLFTPQVSTTGSRFTLNGPTFSILSYNIDQPTSTAKGVNIYNGGLMSTSSINGANIAILQGFVTPTANGNIIVRFASEVANSSITARAGSTCEYWSY